jgi:hypothetical protein
MAMRLTHERLIEVLSYDPRSGQMTWKVRLSTIRKAGDVAGGSYGSYSFVTVDKVMYLAHRLCWFYVTGTWPSGEIDHINGIPTDNNLGPLVYGVFLEFGHPIVSKKGQVIGHAPPYPFMRAAFEENKSQLPELIKAELAKAIEASVKRLRK